MFSSAWTIQSFKDVIADQPAIVKFLGNPLVGAALGAIAAKSLSVSVVGVGDVSQCDVFDCTYNEGQRCTAEPITFTFGNDTAQCATYTTSSGATG